MKVTIAVDDISMPLPIMRTPGRAPDSCSRSCARCSPITASTTSTSSSRLGLHRRMHDWEIKRMVGEKVWNAYWPDRLYNHDGCDPDGMVVLGKTPHGELVEMNRRVAESDLTIYVNLNFVPMNGGHKSMARRAVRLREPQGAPHAQGASSSPTRSWTRRSRYLSHSFKRQGDLIEKTLKVFHIETVLNNRAFDGPLVVPDEERGRLHRDRSPEVPGDEVDARQAAVRGAPRDLHAHAGGLRADRAATPARASRRTTSTLAKQQRAELRRGRGPGRHPASSASRTSRRTTSTARRSTRCSCR